MRWFFLIFFFRLKKTSWKINYRSVNKNLQQLRSNLEKCPSFVSLRIYILHPVYTGPDNSNGCIFYLFNPLHGTVQILLQLAVLFAVYKLSRFHGSRVNKRRNPTSFCPFKNCPGRVNGVLIYNLRGISILKLRFKCLNIVLWCCLCLFVLGWS